MDPALGVGDSAGGGAWALPQAGGAALALEAKNPLSPGSLGPILPLSPILSPGPLRPCQLSSALTSPVLCSGTLPLPRLLSVSFVLPFHCLPPLSLLFCLTLFLSLSVSLCLFSSPPPVSPTPSPALPQPGFFTLFGPRASFLPILPSLLVRALP